MEKHQIITLRRALLNYQQLVVDEQLEGFSEAAPSELQWTSADWKRELENVSVLLEKFKTDDQ